MPGMLIGAFFLLGLCLAALVAGIRLWPGSEVWLGSACLLASNLAGLAYWRVRRRRDPSFGIAFAGLVLTWLCLEYVPSGRWPLTVDGAVTEVYSWLDAGERRDLAYLHGSQIIGLHFGMGMGIRNGLGMWDGNAWLVRNCGKGSSSPDDCSQVILEALRMRLRAELPEAERKAVELLDSRIDRVRVPARAFEKAPVAEVIAHLQAAIDSQLPENDRFRIELDPGSVGEFTYSQMGAVGLAEWLVGLNTHSGGSVEKYPPNLRVEPYYRQVQGLPRDLALQPLFETGNGFDGDLREIVRDEPAWRRLWARISPGPSGTAMPAVDFSRHAVLVVALGRDAIIEPRGRIEATLLGERHGIAHFRVVEQEYSGSCPQYQPPPGPLPLSVFLVPIQVGEAAFSFHESATSCPAPQANQP
jgi:hypothetical protein